MNDLSRYTYTPALIEAARQLVERIYKPGNVYNKAGIFLADIVADRELQQSALIRVDSARQIQLMETVDRINRKYGRHTVRPLSLLTERPWEMRREHLSKKYTTR